MKIYAIKDRLIDYYMRPFAADNDKEVLASIAQGVNTGDPQSAICQNPHQFEIWRLGEVTDEGNIVQDKELLADASSLIRERVRPTTDEGANALHRATGGQPGSPGQTAPNGRAGLSAAQDAAQATNR